MKTASFDLKNGRFTGQIIKQNNKTVIVDFVNPESKDKKIIINRHIVKHNVVEIHDNATPTIE